MNDDTRHGDRLRWLWDALPLDNQAWSNFSAHVADSQIGQAFEFVKLEATAPGKPRFQHKRRVYVPTDDDCHLAMLLDGDPTSTGNPKWLTIASKLSTDLKIPKADLVVMSPPDILRSMPNYWYQRSSDRIIRQSNAPGVKTEARHQLRDSLCRLFGDSFGKHDRVCDLIPWGLANSIRELAELAGFKEPPMLVIGGLRNSSDDFERLITIFDPPDYGTSPGGCRYDGQNNGILVHYHLEPQFVIRLQQVMSRWIYILENWPFGLEGKIPAVVPLNPGTDNPSLTTNKKQKPAAANTNADRIATRNEWIRSNFRTINFDSFLPAFKDACRKNNWKYIGSRSQLRKIADGTK